jgi:hypothetical protein
MSTQSDCTESARFMRESAGRLRQLAGIQSFLEVQLMGIAEGLEARAARLEAVVSGVT